METKMKRTDSIIELAAECRRAERALYRHWHKEDDTLWNAACKPCCEAESQLLKWKPVNYEEATVIIDFVRRDLACWEQIKPLSEDLKKPAATLKKGRHESCITWVQIDLLFSG
jgi:hypothetical protein